jgi:ABC-type transporter Mla MlaB component
VVGLVDLFGGECVSLRADGEVQLQPHEESNRALAQTLDAVEPWLEKTRIGSADVWVDERPYRIDRPRSLYQVASAQVNGADSPAKGCSSPTESAQPRSTRGSSGGGSMTKLALLSDREVRVARLPGEIAVISLLGEHDVTTAWEVRNAIAFALDQGTHLVVDLSETEFIDSSIVHALVDSVQLASAQGATDQPAAADTRQRQTHARNHARNQRARSTACLRNPRRGHRCRQADARPEFNAAGIGSRTTTVERREKWRCSWL